MEKGNFKWKNLGRLHIAYVHILGRPHTERTPVFGYKEMSYEAKKTVWE